MQATDAGKQHTGMQEMASTATQREAIHATLETAMAGGVVLIILVLLFLASVVYVVFGGTYEVEAAPGPETSIAALAAELAGAGDARRNEEAAGSYAEQVNYFPAGYVKRSCDGDGNAVTYEHD